MPVPYMRVSIITYTKLSQGLFDRFWHPSVLVSLGQKLSKIFYDENIFLCKSKSKKMIGSLLVPILTIFCMKSSSSALLIYLMFKYNPIAFFRWIFQEAIKGLLKTVNEVANFAKNIGNKIAAVVMEIIGKIDRFVKGAVNKVKNTGKKVVNDIANGGKKVVNQVAGAGKGVIDKVEGFGKNAVDQVAGAGKMVIDKVSGAGRDIGNKVAGAGKKAVDEVAGAGKKVVDEIGKQLSKF